MARMAMAALRFHTHGSRVDVDSFFTGTALLSIELPANSPIRSQAPPPTPAFVSTAAMHTLLPQRASRAEGFHLRVLLKPCVNLSIYTASDVQPPTFTNRQ